MIEEVEVYKKAFDIACSNRVLSFNDPAIDALFKAVKKALGNDVISRIEHSKRDKVILIPSNDNELAKGIVSYIWYTHPPVRVGGGYQYICLRYWNCSRLQEKQIEQDLTKWYLEMHESRTPPPTPISPFRSNVDLTEKINLSDRWKSIWFLQNIKEGYLKVFERLLKIANEYKLGDERSLIVSTDKVDNLPQELSRQFELIKPEIEEKSIPASTPQDTASKQQKNVFRWCCGTWEITFEGQTIRPADSYGLRYIHCLLVNPSKKIHVSELMKALPRRQKSQLLLEKGEKIEFEDELNGSTADDSVGEAALKQYKERLAELSGDIKRAEKSGNSMELEELRKEFNEITDYLKTVTGRKGRPRKLLDQSENQRQAVKNCIIDAFAAIKKEHTPLHKHFKIEKTIKLGLDCSYNPPRATSWVTR